MRSHSPHGARSNEISADPVVPKVPAICQLNTDLGARMRLSMVLKLTDECSQAFNKALEMNWPVRVISTRQGVVVEVGTGPNSSTKFNSNLQELNGAMDAICHEGPSTFGNVSSLRSKIVVNATDKTFAETREKAHKLVEQEQRKMTKETQLGNGARKRPHANAVPALKNNVVHTKKTSPPAQHVAGPKAIQRPNGAKVSAAVTGVVQNRTELLKRPIRERVVHLCAGGKFKNEDEVLERLKFEGLAKDRPVDELVSEARTILKDISVVEADCISLKPPFFNEIDLRWPGFVSSEKARARRLTSVQTLGSTSVAPSRKSGVAPVLAPSAGHEAKCKPANGNTPVIESRPRSPAIPTPGRPETKKRSREASPPPEPAKRPSPALTITSSTSSTTSPVDESFANAKKTTAAHPKNNSEPGQAILTHTKGALSTPVQSATDWEKVYRPVQDGQQALNYHDIFEREYPVYRKVYEKLSKVSSEFNGLKHEFDQAQLGSALQNEILRKIYDRYDSYQNDRDFYQDRSKHATLHTKLAVLKRRILEWDRRLLGEHPDLAEFEGKRDDRHRRSLSSGNSASSTTSMDSSGSGPHGFDEF